MDRWFLYYTSIKLNKLNGIIDLNNKYIITLSSEKRLILFIIPWLNLTDKLIWKIQ